MFHFINFSDPHTLNYIKTIGYPTMFIIMVLEGPIMTILGAFLASLGFFNIFIIFFLSIFGDIVGDMGLFAIGYFGGKKILKKAEKFLRIKETTIEKLNKLFLEHGKKTIFYVKSTTGLCWITFIAAGTSEMRFKDFLIASFWGGVVWSLILSIVGFFFGYAFEKIDDIIKYAGLLTFSVALLFFVSLSFYKKYRAKKMFEDEK